MFNKRDNKLSKNIGRNNLDKSNSKMKVTKVEKSYHLEV